MVNCSNWASTSEKPAWASTLHVDASPRRKPGAFSFRITSGPWYRSTSSRCRRSIFRFYTCFWTAQQLREAFPFDHAPKYLLRDRDRIFGAEFSKQVASLGMEEVVYPGTADIAVQLD